MTKTAILLLAILLALMMVGGVVAYKCELDLSPRSYASFLIED